MLETIITWLFNHYIELIATITALIYLILSIKQNVWLWFFGLAASGIYVFVFYSSKLYADMAINMYYVIVSIYGWVHWVVRSEGSQKKTFTIASLSRNQWVYTVISIAVLTLAIAFILKEFTDSDVVYPDAFTTAGSVIATYYLARKVIDHWILWVVIDGASIALYMYKELYPTAILFIVYTIFAIVGYREWKKSMNVTAK
jgi:nicotinamide mononucleotide transporter